MAESESLVLLGNDFSAFAASFGSDADCSEAASILILSMGASLRASTETEYWALKLSFDSVTGSWGTGELGSWGASDSISAVLSLASSPVSTIIVGDEFS